MRIYAPVKDANGVWCSVRFVNGVGETDKPHLINWFRAHGYRIENDKSETSSEQLLTDVSESVDDLESMTPNQLREWLKTNGYGHQIKNIRDKEKLLKIARG